jgi:hypothetical protein
VGGGEMMNFDSWESTENTQIKNRKTVKTGFIFFKLLVLKLLKKEEYPLKIIFCYENQSFFNS